MGFGGSRPFPRICCAQHIKQYVENNRDRIVNYRERQKNGKVFTSNLAESTVESLINQRCKGQQHMLWSREGLNPILQLRAKIHSNDWDNKWKTVVLNSLMRKLNILHFHNPTRKISVRG